MFWDGFSVHFRPFPAFFWSVWNWNNALHCIRFSFVRIIIRRKSKRTEVEEGGTKERVLIWTKHVLFSFLYLLLWQEEIQFRQTKNRIHMLITMINDFMVRSLYLCYASTSPTPYTKYMCTSNRKEIQFSQLYDKMCNSVFCIVCVCGRNLHAYVKFLRWKMR